MRWLVLVSCLATIACSGGRVVPAGLDTPRADRLPRLRVERLVDDGAAVGLDRVAGSFKVVRVGAVVDLPYAAAFEAEGADGDRIRVLFDHVPEESIPLPDGADVVVRYADVGRDGQRHAPVYHAALVIRDADGGLLFATVVRPPGAAPSPEEELLPPSLRPEATEERVYREFLRQETYCTTERDHFAARLPGGARTSLLLPGTRAEVTYGGRPWRLHLLDVSRVARTECADRPPDWIAYQIVAVPR